MERGLLGFLTTPDFDDVDALFNQRETGQERTPFDMERQLYSFVTRGEPEEMVAFYANMLENSPDFRLPVGKLSTDKLRQTKYLAISMIAVICRIAMSSGVPEALAYSMSDDAILHIDKMDNPDDILLFEMNAIYDYTVEVAKCKAASAYSKHIRTATDYIVANLHSDISLNNLAKNTPYSAAYLAKRFKKEVGKTVSDYILACRVDEAKKMIQSGKSFREIAYLLHFCSQSYFIDQFKKVTSMTPGQYRDLRNLSLAERS